MMTPERFIRVLGIMTFVSCLGCTPKPVRTPPSLTSPGASQAANKAAAVTYTYLFTMTTPSQHNPLEFKDDVLHIRFIPREVVIEFAVYNVGTAPFTILWNQARFIDPQGLPHPIVHKGIILADTERRQVPTLVLPQGMLNDTIAPVDYIYNSPAGWRQHPIFPKTEDALKLKGSAFGVVLPIKVQETIKSYSFQFQVTDVQAVTVVR